MKRRMMTKLASGDLWKVLIVYLAYVIPVSFAADVPLSERYSFSPYLHFVLMMGFLLYLDLHNGLFLNKYCLIRFQNRRKTIQSRLGFLWKEVLLFWGPQFLMMVFSCGLGGKPLLASLAASLFWLAMLYLTGVFVCFTDVKLEKRHWGEILAGLLLNGDYLIYTGLIWQRERSLFYELAFPVFRPAGLPDALLKLFGISCILLILIVFVFWEKIKEWFISHSFIRFYFLPALAGIPVGVLIGAMQLHRKAAFLEVFWLYSFGMEKAQGSSFFSLLLFQVLPFLLELLLLGSLISSDEGNKAILLLTRGGSRKKWWRSRQAGLSAACLLYSSGMLAAVTVVGVLSGLKLYRTETGIAVLIGLLATRFHIEALLISIANLFSFYGDRLSVTFLVTGAFSGGYLMTFLPEGPAVQALLTVFLPARAALLAHRAPERLRVLEGLFADPVSGFRIEHTALLAVAVWVLLFVFGHKLTEKADLF